jgi:hypothetical protein
MIITESQTSVETIEKLNESSNDEEKLEENYQPKSGRNHAGAKYLASQYSKAKRTQEIIGFTICVLLMIYNFFNFCFYFDIKRWHIVLISGCK